jgi:hypothetical protein
VPTSTAEIREGQVWRNGKFVILITDAGPTEVDLVVLSYDFSRPIYGWQPGAHRSMPNEGLRKFWQLAQ